MAKTDFLTADMTRRQFMKISGKSLAVTDIFLFLKMI